MLYTNSVSDLGCMNRHESRAKPFSSTICLAILELGLFSNVVVLFGSHTYHVPDTLISTQP